MYEIQALEWVVLLDASVHVHAAVLAGVALDHGGLIDDFEFVFARRDFKLLDGYNADDGEEGVFRLPAFGAAARVVVGNIA